MMVPAGWFDALTDVAKISEIRHAEELPPVLLGQLLHEIDAIRLGIVQPHADAVDFFPAAILSGDVLDDLIAQCLVLPLALIGSAVSEEKDGFDVLSESLMERLAGRSPTGHVLQKLLDELLGATLAGGIHRDRGAAPDRNIDFPIGRVEADHLQRLGGRHPPDNRAADFPNLRAEVLIFRIVRLIVIQGIDAS